MNENENSHRQRHFSIDSERTLDSLAQIASPSVTSPEGTPKKEAGNMDERIGPDYRPGSSRPPHHHRGPPHHHRDHHDHQYDGQRYVREGHLAPPSVSWQSDQQVVEVSPDDSDHRGSYQSVEQGDRNLSTSPTFQQGRVSLNLPEVATGTESSPVRKLKRKEERPAKVERELSDAYIDSISRTPRYEYGRHNTYDEMLRDMSHGDPFKGDYQTSGKSPSPRDKSKIPKLKKKGQKGQSPHETDERAQTFPMENIPQKMDTRLSLKKRSRKKRKGQKGEESAESTATFTVEAHTNSAYTKSADEQPETTSMKSNGTYTLEEQKKAVVVSTAPDTRRVPHKVKSMDQQMKTETDIDHEGVARYVADSQIKQRECKCYVRDHRSSVHKSHCMCGREELWHELKGLDIPDTQDKHIWHSKTHSEAFPCDSFGEVQFQGFGQDTSGCAPYIRLCPMTDMETVWDLLAEQWHLPIPKLLISVTGGAQRFDLNPRLKAVFKRGLINAATTTGAWIITGGTATGVMRFVGEAVRDHLLTLGHNDNSVVALGIATWGRVANRNALDGDGDKGLFPAPYLLEDLADVKSKDVPLDHNHTHFLLVDDGTEGKFGREIEFRAQLERYISVKVETGVAESQSVNVPVVMLVVEGGVNTMKTVWQAVNQNIPVLVLNGSGRAADFIAYGYQLTKDMNEDKSRFSSEFEEEMKAVAWEKFAWKANDNVDMKVYECVKQLKDSLTKRKLISIFNIAEADTKDIDRAILYALLKANKTNANAQLALALAWNRCDIARHEIFTHQNREYWKNIPLYDAMFTALVQDRVDFVHLFLENGVSLRKFLSIETLWNLYANVFKETSDTTAQLLFNLVLYLKQSWGAYLCCRQSSVAGADPDLLYNVGKVLVHLLGDEAMNSYSDSKFVVSRKGAEMKWLPGNHLQKTGTDPQQTKVESARRFYKRKRYEYDFNKEPERELFFWAILLNRRDLGKMFWRMGHDQIGSALVACSILKALAAIADDDEELELSTDLMEHANMYEGMAAAVLTECYKKDKKMAHQLLVRRLEPYGRTTLFSLADSNTLMHFMGNTSCQTKLNLIWKGRMALYTQTWKIFLALLVPFCILWIKFTTNAPLIGTEPDEDYDDLEEEEDNPETPKDDVHILSKNKVTPNKDDEPEEEFFVRSKSRRKKLSRKKLYRVTMFNDRRTNSIGLFNAIYYFYTAPCTVFYTNTASYIAFLGIFTYFLLTDLHPENVSTQEYVTWGWTITMAIEELRQVFTRDQRSLWYKIRSWFSSMWNRFDLTMYMFFIISVALRFSLKGEDFVWARITYSVTLSMYYMRFMQMFFVEKNIGPKVIMIRNMLIDLMFFFLIFVVFLLSFGVAYQANLYPNSEPTWGLLKSVVYIPYWQMYGELFLENMEADPQDPCTKNETVWRAGGMDRCPEQNALVPLLAAIYLILTNILLVNLLIAMFSYTFQMVQDKSEQVWRFYRFSLVYEFYDRPMFCPPLITLSHIFRAIQWVRRKTCSSAKYHNEFKLNLDEKDHNRLRVFVKSAVENYLNITQMAAREEINNKVTSAANRIEKVIEELDNIKDNIKQSNPLSSGTLTRPTTAEPSGETVDGHAPLSTRRQSKLDANIESMYHRMSELSDQVEHSNEQMEKLMKIVLDLAAASQYRSRPSQLEITDVTRYQSDNL